MDKYATTSYAGYNGFIKGIYKISRAEFDKATEFLIDKHFIELVRKTKTFTYYRILIPPLHNGKKILPMYPNHYMCMDDLYELGHGFIRLPLNFIAYLKSKLNIETDITLKELLLLLKLYSYTFPEVYGGVCNTVIFRETRRHIFLRAFLIEDVHMTVQEFMQAINKFEKLNLFHWAQIIVNKEDVQGIPQRQYLKVYIGGPVMKGHRSEEIIRLNYLPPPMRK